MGYTTTDGLNHTQHNICSADVDFATPDRDVFVDFECQFVAAEGSNNDDTNTTYGDPNDPCGGCNGGPDDCCGIAYEVTPSDMCMNMGMGCPSEDQ